MRSALRKLCYVLLLIGVGNIAYLIFFGSLPYTPWLFFLGAFALILTPFILALLYPKNQPFKRPGVMRYRQFLYGYYRLLGHLTALLSLTPLILGVCMLHTYFFNASHEGVKEVISFDLSGITPITIQRVEQQDSTAGIILPPPPPFNSLIDKHQ